MGIKLTFPCNENLKRMPDTSLGKYCNQCDKSIVDFTDWDKDEILEYISSRQACGIFKNSQLDGIGTSEIVRIKPRLKWVSKITASLTLLTMLLSACSDKGNTQNTEKNKKNRTEQEKESCTVTLGRPIAPHIQSIDSNGEIVGMVAPDNEPDSNGVYPYAEVMPMFKGGEDSLVAYLTENMNYPEYELKNKIEGTIYARFVVNEKGEVNDIKIIKSIERAKNFDNEVIRVLNRMPKWQSGKNNGEAVKVYYTLPVQFEL